MKDEFRIHPSSLILHPLIGGWAVPMEALRDKLNQVMTVAAETLRGRDDHVRRIIEHARILHSSSSRTPSCIAFRNVANGYTYFYPGDAPLDTEWLRHARLHEIAERIAQAVRDAIARGELPTEEQAARRARRPAGVDFTPPRPTTSPSQTQALD